MINVAELMSDPDFVQTLPVERTSTTIATTGDAAGESIVATSNTTVVAAAMPISDPDDLLILPEGLRSNKAIKLYSKTEIFADDGDDNSTSPAAAIVDIVTYNSERYRIAHVKPYGQYGYYYGIGIATTRSPA